jgi:hypothetical protein
MKPDALRFCRLIDHYEDLQSSRFDEFEQSRHGVTDRTGAGLGGDLGSFGHDGSFAREVGVAAASTAGGGGLTGKNSPRRIATIMGAAIAPMKMVIAL